MHKCSKQRQMHGNRQSDSNRTHVIRTLVDVVDSIHSFIHSVHTLVLKCISSGYSVRCSHVPVALSHPLVHIRCSAIVAVLLMVAGYQGIQYNTYTPLRTTITKASPVLTHKTMQKSASFRRLIFFLFTFQWQLFDEIYFQIKY